MDAILNGLSGSDTLAVIFGAAWAVSEALSLIPAVKANGIFQGVYGLLKRISGKTGV